METSTFFSRIALFIRTLLGKDTVVTETEKPVPSELRHTDKEAVVRRKRVATADPVSHLLFHLGSLSEDLRMIKQRGGHHGQGQLLCDHQGLGDLVNSQLIQRGELHIPTVVRCEQAGYHIVHLRQQDEVLLCTPHGNLTMSLVEEERNTSGTSESFESVKREDTSRVAKLNPKTARNHHDTQVTHTSRVRHTQ